MRKFVRYLLLSLVLLMVAMGSALTAMRFAIHGREVNVPQLVGATPAEARDRAAENGLILVEENQFYSNDVPKGRIVSQQPPPGAKVRRGWRLRVAQSLGPQQAEVPDVLGQSLRAAEINIRRRGLELAQPSVMALEGVEAGRVVAQTPPPNSTSATSPKIALLSAADAPPAFVMPDFVGKHVADVAESIERAGFILGSVTTSGGSVSLAPNDKPGKARLVGVPRSSTVVKQLPAAGEKIAAGATISLEIAP